MTQFFTVHSKSKKKRANTAAARQLDKDWQDLMKKWEPKKPLVAKKTVSLEAKTYVRETAQHPSRGSGIGVATKADAKVYTGDKVIGVAVMHKSCLQPIFNEEAAKDSASMRR